MVGASSWRLLCEERARRDVAMYRLVIPMLLYLGAVVGAPQDSNKSGETYVKIDPVNQTTFQNLTPDSSESQNEAASNNLSIDRNDDVTTVLDQLDETTEITEAVTEIHVPTDQAVLPAEEIKTRTKPPSPRFYSKLSYFQKPDYAGPSLANLVERNSKRKFKSRCRCEKIWNCPKLQITVPRCPDEYFMCCF